MSLAELAVAMGLLLVLVSSLFSAFRPADGLFATQTEAADMQQRLRAALDALRRDLSAAVFRRVDWPRRWADDLHRTRRSSSPDRTSQIGTRTTSFGRRDHRVSSLTAAGRRHPDRPVDAGLQ